MNTATATRIHDCTKWRPTGARYAYAKDIRFHNRICRFDNHDARALAVAGDSFYIPIAEEEDAILMALGYTLDDDFAVWQNASDKAAGIGVGIDANSQAAIDSVIGVVHNIDDLFYIV